LSQEGLGNSVSKTSAHTSSKELPFEKEPGIQKEGSGQKQLGTRQGHVAVKAPGRVKTRNIKRDLPWAIAPVITHNKRPAKRMHSIRCKGQRRHEGGTQTMKGSETIRCFSDHKT